MPEEVASASVDVAVEVAASVVAIVDVRVAVLVPVVALGEVGVWNVEVHLSNPTGHACKAKSANCAQIPTAGNRQGPADFKAHPAHPTWVLMLVLVLVLVLVDVLLVVPVVTAIVVSDEASF